MRAKSSKQRCPALCSIKTIKGQLYVQYNVKIVYFAEMISIVLKEEADSGTMPAPVFTRIMFGFQLKPLTRDT